jgi:hypothetical protein
MSWQSEIVYVLQIKAITLAVVVPVIIAATFVWRILRGTPLREADDRHQFVKLLGVLVLISVLSFPNDYGERFGFHGVWKLVLTAVVGAPVIALAYLADRWMTRQIAKSSAPLQPPRGDAA